MFSLSNRTYLVVQLLGSAVIYLVVCVVLWPAYSTWPRAAVFFLIAMLWVGGFGAGIYKSQSAEASR